MRRTVEEGRANVKTLGLEGNRVPWVEDRKRPVWLQQNEMGIADEGRERTGPDPWAGVIQTSFLEEETEAHRAK